jgi:hypothetical protein
VPEAPPNRRTNASLRSRVARKLEAERHRHGVLHPGTRDRGGAAVLADQHGERIDRAIEIDDERVDDGAQFQHQRRVDDVLARGAPMHIAGCLGVCLGDLGGQRLDQRNGDIARCHGFLANGGDVVAVRAGCLGDGIDRDRRDHADRGLCARQRYFDIEHVLQAGAVIDDGSHRRARGQRREQRGGEQWTGHR